MTGSEGRATSSSMESRPNDEQDDDSEIMRQREDRVHQLLIDETAFDDEELQALFYFFPSLASIKYEWEWAGGFHPPEELFPLQRMCCCKPSIALVILTYEAYPEAIMERANGGATPLFFALQNKAPKEVICYLVTKYKDAIKLSGNAGKYPLHVAVESPDMAQLACYLAMECPDALAIREERTGKLPLHLACEQRCPLDVIRCLAILYEEGLKTRDGFGMIPLHWVCEHVRRTEDPPLDLILFLFSAYPDGAKVQIPNSAEIPVVSWTERKRNKGMFALHLACDNQLPLCVVRMLTSHYPEALKEKDAEGRTPLHLAVQRGELLDVIQFLFSQYPEAIKVRDAVGMTPLAVACKHKAKPQVIEFLAWRYPDSIKILDDRGFLPLHWACVSSSFGSHGCSFDTIRFLSQQYPAALRVRTTLDFRPERFSIHGYEICGGKLPLHIACENSSLEVVRFMLSLYPGAIKEKDANGAFPLHLACKGGNLRSIMFMLFSYPDAVKIKDGDGRYPLHWACKSVAPLEAVRFLVSMNRDALKEEDKSEHVPFELAMAQGRAEDVISFLVSEDPEVAKDRHQNPLTLYGTSWMPSSFLRAMVSEFPASVGDNVMDHVNFDDSEWRMERDVDWDVSAFWCWSNGNNGDLGDDQPLEVFHHDTDFRMCVIRCDDDQSLKKIVSILRRVAPVEAIEVVSSGMRPQMLRPISDEIRGHTTLQYLGLGNNLIGDTGVQFLAMSLVTNKVLETLDLRSCGIGLDGISNLLRALESNETLKELNISYNPSIFNLRGGKTIVSLLSKKQCLRRLYLFCAEDTSRSRDFKAFVAEFLNMLCWKNPKWRNPAYWPVLLNHLSAHTWQAIEYFPESCHVNIISSSPAARGRLWHYMLGKANIESRSNEEVLFSYIKAMPECFTARV